MQICQNNSFLRTTIKICKIGGVLVKKQPFVNLVLILGQNSKPKTQSHCSSSQSSRGGGSQIRRPSPPDLDGRPPKPSHSDLISLPHCATGIQERTTVDKQASSQSSGGGGLIQRPSPNLTGQPPEPSPGAQCYLSIPSSAVKRGELLTNNPFDRLGFFFLSMEGKGWTMTIVAFRWIAASSPEHHWSYPGGHHLPQIGEG